MKWYESGWEGKKEILDANTHTQIICRMQVLLVLSYSMLFIYHQMHCNFREYIYLRIYVITKRTTESLYLSICMFVDVYIHINTGQKKHKALKLNKSFEQMCQRYSSLSLSYSHKYKRFLNAMLSCYCNSDTLIYARMRPS